MFHTPSWVYVQTLRALLQLSMQHVQLSLVLIYHFRILTFELELQADFLKVKMLHGGGGIGKIVMPGV